MTELNKETKVATALLGYLDALYFHYSNMVEWEQQLRDLDVNVDAIRGVALVVSRQKDSPRPYNPEFIAWLKGAEQGHGKL